MEEIVNGIGTFREAFTPFADSFIVIGPGCLDRYEVSQSEEICRDEVAFGFIRILIYICGEYHHNGNKDKENTRFSSKRFPAVFILDGQSGIGPEGTDVVCPQRMA